MRRIALFAHYDAQTEIKPYIVFYLRRLREVCDDVIFVSNSPLPKPEIAKATPHCSQVLLHANVGYDFLMWRLGIERIEPENWDELVLTNSSIFGPIHPLGRVFARMGDVACDFWGMTESKEIAWHLQSYFIVFRRRPIVSGAFHDFWKAVLPYRDKHQVVRSYEIGLSTFFCEQGFAPAVFVPTSQLPGRRFRQSKFNPLLERPQLLIERGMPFVKVELLRANPFGAKLAPVYTALQAAGYDGSLLTFDRPRVAK